MQTSRFSFSFAVSIATSTIAVANPTPYTTTFENGTEGWSVSGRNDIGSESGNPGAAIDVQVIDVFSADIRNDDNNRRFMGDYTTLGPFRLSVQVKIDSINIFDTEVPRTLIVELRDTTTPNPLGLPYTSVWYALGTIESSQPGWRTFAVDVTDPHATSLPAGWGGYGDEDSTGAPRLPANRTFTSVLQRVDELHFTTGVPGYFYAFTTYLMQVDNISLSRICAADFNGDSIVDFFDYLDFVAAFADGTPASDFNSDGIVDFFDYLDFVQAFTTGC